MLRKLAAASGAGIFERAILNIEVQGLVGSAGRPDIESRGITGGEDIGAAKRGVANVSAAERQCEGDVCAGAGKAVLSVTMLNPPVPVTFIFTFLARLLSRS